MKTFSATITAAKRPKENKMKYKVYAETSFDVHNLGSFDNFTEAVEAAKEWYDSFAPGIYRFAEVQSSEKKVLRRFAHITMDR